MAEAGATKEPKDKSTTSGGKELVIRNSYDKIGDLFSELRKRGLVKRSGKSDEYFNFNLTDLKSGKARIKNTSTSLGETGWSLRNTGLSGEYWLSTQTVIGVGLKSIGMPNDVRDITFNIKPGKATYFMGEERGGKRDEKERIELDCRSFLTSRGTDVEAELFQSKLSGVLDMIRQTPPFAKGA